MPKIIDQNKIIGEERLNHYGSSMIIEKYNNAHEVWVRFTETGNVVKTQWGNFISGKVRNVYDKTIYGVAFIGEGKYKVSVNGKYIHQYVIWYNMLTRCHSQKWHEKYPYYRGCTVCDEWLNFQNFAAWYDQNFYQIEGQKMHLDKDILFKRNKVYSPETCVFVPKNINSLFVKCDSVRGKYPVGVCKRNDRVNKPYSVSCNNNKGESIHFGYYSDIKEAFLVYKKQKEIIIKTIADEFRDNIPEKLYDAMVSYQVEIYD
jgi:hypothetical protein